MTQVITKINEIKEGIKALKQQRESIGFVPTMGALHIGHESLIKKACEECDRVVVSIFVNPIQFGPNEDYGKYPRQLEADRDICEKFNVDIIFAPSSEDIYPNKVAITTVVPPTEYKDKLCGKARIGHFEGVATIVLKLFNIVQPDKAYFGQKDAQQLIIIKKMVNDLNIPVEIIGCPIIRDEDGLACSSRNAYLTSEDRQKALTISKVLRKINKNYEVGIKDSNILINQGLKVLHKDIKLEYLEILNAETLEKLNFVEKNTLIAIAVKIGKIRLIDNLLI